VTEPAELIAQILELDAWCDVQKKKFDAHMLPHREQIEAWKNQLQEYLLNNADRTHEHPKASFACDAGTAYLSTIVTPSIDGDKTHFLDWIEENWDERGAMLQIGAPQKAALEEWRDAHQGQLPPHVKISSLTRVNVRRS
jgi:hypothetical protein